MVVAHFFESGSGRPVYVGAESGAPANGRAVALAATGYIACDRRKGLRRANVGSAGVRVPTRLSGIAHGDSSRGRVRRGAGRVSLLERGLDRAQCGRGDRL